MVVTVTTTVIVTDPVAGLLVIRRSIALSGICGASVSISKAEYRAEHSEHRKKHSSAEKISRRFSPHARMMIAVRMGAQYRCDQWKPESRSVAVKNLVNSDEYWSVNGSGGRRGNSGPKPTAIHSDPMD